jgi:hypothetical protein
MNPSRRVLWRKSLLSIEGLASASVQKFRFFLTHYTIYSAYFRFNIHLDKIFFLFFYQYIQFLF